MEILISGLPECLCRSATAFRFFLCDLTRLELRLHGPGGRGRQGEDRPSPLCHGVQDEEPERTQRPERQAVLRTGVPEARLWMETIKQKKKKKKNAEFGRLHRTQNHKIIVFIRFAADRTLVE